MLKEKPEAHPWGGGIWTGWQSTSGPPLGLLRCRSRIMKCRPWEALPEVRNCPVRLTPRSFSYWVAY